MIDNVSRLRKQVVNFEKSESENILSGLVLAVQESRRNLLEHNFRKYELRSSIDEHELRLAKLKALQYSMEKIESKIKSASELVSNSENGKRKRNFADELEQTAKLITELKSLASERKKLKIMCTEQYRKNKKSENFSKSLFENLSKLKNACDSVTNSIGLPININLKLEEATLELPYPLFSLYHSVTGHKVGIAKIVRNKEARDPKLNRFSLEINPFDMKSIALVFYVNGDSSRCGVKAVGFDPRLLQGIFPDDAGTRMDATNKDIIEYDWSRVLCGFGLPQTAETQRWTEFRKDFKSLSSFNVAKLLQVLSARLNSFGSVEKQIEQLNGSKIPGLDLNVKKLVKTLAEKQNTISPLLELTATIASEELTVNLNIKIFADYPQRIPVYGIRLFEERGMVRYANPLRDFVSEKEFEVRKNRNFEKQLLKELYREGTKERERDLCFQKQIEAAVKFVQSHIAAVKSEDVHKKRKFFDDSKPKIFEGKERFVVIGRSVNQ